MLCNTLISDYRVVKVQEVVSYLQNGYLLYGSVVNNNSTNQPEELLQAVVKLSAHPTKTSRKKQVILSRIESQILTLVVAGYTAKEIALKVHRSARTIENMTRQLCRKFHCRRSIQLPLLALKAGIDITAPSY